MTSPTNSENHPNRRLSHPRGSTPLVRDSWSSYWSYPDEEAIRRHEQLERRRQERKARRAEREAQELQDNKNRIMVVSAFMCAGVSLSIMTRLGDSLLSSVVYGVMIGLFVSLLTAVAVSLLGMEGIWDSSILVDEWTDDYFNEEYDYDDDYDDFAGLGEAMAFAGTAWADQSSVMTAEFVPVSENCDMEIGVTSPQADMRAFIDALATDAQAPEDDIIV